MKLKDIVQIAVLTVIGFAVGMVVSMFTGTLGAIALYASAGFAAFVVGPVFVIMSKKAQKRGAAALFWVIYGLLYSAMGYWIMIPICLVSAILSELIKVVGVEGIVKFASSIGREQAEWMANFYTNKAIAIAIGCNIALELLAGRFGVYINNKFFEKRKEKGIL